MRGSDSERMIAEIEAFLRTGEAPPAAPEPETSSPPPARPHLFDELDGASGSGPEGPDGLGGAARRPRGRQAGAPGGRAVQPGSRRRYRWRTRSGYRSWWRRLQARLEGPRAGAPRVSWSPPPARLRPSHRPLVRAGGSARFPSPPGGTGRRVRSAPAEPPRWTPLRAVAVAALLIGLLVLPAVWSGRGSPSGGDGPDHASAAPAGPGYTFAKLNRSGTPVRWDPCSPIYYETYLTGAPEYAAADLQQAVAAISRATGISFVDEGAAPSFPTNGPQLSDGGGPGPVVIAWADPVQSGQLGLDLSLPSGGEPVSADSLGRTLPIEAVDEATGHGVYVTGSVVIASAAAQLREGSGPGGLEMVLEHQLGHLMGLGTVHDPAQLMSSQFVPTRDAALGSGDAAGLQRLGTASGCLQVPVNASYEPSI